MIKNQCLNCNKETKNPKFCSRSCAASFNNKIFQKRKPENNCKKCNISISTNRVYCRNSNMTLGEAIYKKLHKSSAFALIRTRARAINKKLGITNCQLCGYNKHVEVAHKTKISSYPIETLISVINHSNNLIFLCPNCHWEFDHNKLEQSFLNKLTLIVN